MTTPILQQLETGILALVAPLLTADRGADGNLMRIQVESFATPEQMGELLDKFQSRMPCGFLSTPAVTFPATGNRALDWTIDYSFLAGWAAVGSTLARREDRRHRAYQFHDDFLSRVSGQRPAASIDGVGCPPPFLEVLKSEIAETDATAAILIQFRLELKNAILNTIPPR